MSHRFYLKPNVTLLNHCGYLNDVMTQLLTVDLANSGAVQLEVTTVWTEQQRLTIEESFANLVKLYNISEHFDTLLYASLLESDHSHRVYINILDTYKQRLRDRELAQFLLLFKPDAKHKPVNLKISTLTDTVKLTDPDLISWFGVLIKQFLENRQFVPGLHGASLFKFILNDDGSIKSDSKLNYDVIEELANSKIRKPGIRDRNKALKTFLFTLWNILDKETILTTNQAVRFSDDQLKFLFEVAEILGWLEKLTVDSDPKNYLYTLLTNS